MPAKEVNDRYKRERDQYRKLNTLGRVARVKQQPMPRSAKTLSVKLLRSSSKTIPSYFWRSWTDYKGFGSMANNRTRTRDLKFDVIWSKRHVRKSQYEKEKENLGAAGQEDGLVDKLPPYQFHLLDWSKDPRHTQNPQFNTKLANTLHVQPITSSGISTKHHKTQVGHMSAEAFFFIDSPLHSRTHM